jgi:ligand-binding SRPBCC domain-containing protein
MRHVFRTTAVLPLARPQVFEFFAAAENLQRLTPAELDFRILTPLPIEMRAGTLIRYRLRLAGIPFEWVTRISLWNPPVEFVDEQLKGPYKTWTHQHRFADVDGATQVDDDVHYELPLFPFGEIAAPLVAFQVRRIFAFRALALRKALEI